jgi:hypothetical protein
MGVVATPGTMPWNSARLGRSAMMGLTMRGYLLGFGTKSRWSLWLKVMGISDHFSYSGVVGETTMTSRAMSFCFLIDS